MRCEELDLVKLKQMLKDGVPGPKIKEALGVSKSEQVAYAHAWRIERKIGRPKRTAEELAEAIGRLIKRKDDTDVMLDALATTLRILAQTAGSRLRSATKEKLLHFANEIADLRVRS